jgi:ABC-type dipeptide/oligopeptide/nickel transport system permease component
MILGIVMVYSAMLLALNLLVDISYTVIDPRISVQ